jgi:cell wall assembly regulator SMI1
VEPEEAQKQQQLQELFDRILGVPEPPPMSESVTRLDAWLARHRPDYYAELLPGLTDREWSEFESRLAVKVPDAFRVLYQWRNGRWFLPPASFHGNRSWMPAEDILSTKELMDGMIGFDFEPGWWERAWVPFLHNGAGSHLCVDTAGTDGGRPGQLVEFWNRDHDRPVVSRSLERWFDAFVSSLERDRWEETQYGFECVERRDDTAGDK